MSDLQHNGGFHGVPKCLLEEANQEVPRAPCVASTTPSSGGYLADGWLFGECHAELSWKWENSHQGLLDLNTFLHHLFVYLVKT